LLPVTISASFAFMLPVATPPNTIVFGSERLMMRDMVRTGIWLNLIGIGLMALTMLSLGKWLFGF
ncbi:MAG: anion permease, partial [Flavobacteriales bacterium]